MLKRKLVLFSPKEPDCPNHDKIFQTYFEIMAASSEKEFLDVLSSIPADVAVICLCAPSNEDIESLIFLDALTGPIPVLICTKTLNLEFFRKVSRRGAARFIVCNMDAEKIRDIIRYTIRDTGLKEYFESHWPNSFNLSFRISKLVDEIVHVFPHRIKVWEFAERLEIDRGWLHKLCKQAFGMPLTAILRRVWVHQALRMMQHTNLDNTEIALQLGYNEESSMARDFRKELGYSPNEARKRLIKQRPEKLLR